MLQVPTNILKSHQTKLSSQQHVKYGSNLMSIFSNFCFYFSGVLGKRMLNPKVLKCHEDLITLATYVQGKTMDNKATRSPEISREQVQKLTPSTIWGNHLPVNFILKFPTCISITFQ